MLTNLRNALMAGKRLPYDAEVEYLKQADTVTAYINTGIFPTINMKWEMRAKYESAGLMGSYGGPQGRFDIGRYTGAWAMNRGLETTGGMSNADWHTFTLDGIQNKGFVDSLKINLSSVFTRTYNEPIYLFARSVAYRPNCLSSCYIAYSKIYDENGALVRDYIPVRFTNENGQTEGAMYDRVSDQLFGNAGTGAFVIGPDK